MVHVANPKLEKRFGLVSDAWIHGPYKRAMRASIWEEVPRVWRYDNPTISRHLDLWDGVTTTSPSEYDVLRAEQFLVRETAILAAVWVYHLQLKRVPSETRAKIGLLFIWLNRDPKKQKFKAQERNQILHCHVQIEGWFYPATQAAYDESNKCSRYDCWGIRQENNCGVNRPPLPLKDIRSFNKLRLWRQII